MCLCSSAFFTAPRGFSGLHTFFAPWENRRQLSALAAAATHWGLWGCCPKMQCLHGTNASRQAGGSAQQRSHHATVHCEPSRELAAHAIGTAICVPSCRTQCQHISLCSWSRLHPLVLVLLFAAEPQMLEGRKSCHNSMQCAGGGGKLLFEQQLRGTQNGFAPSAGMELPWGWIGIGMEKGFVLVPTCRSVSTGMVRCTPGSVPSPCI